MPAYAKPTNTSKEERFDADGYVRDLEVLFGEAWELLRAESEEGQQRAYELVEEAVEAIRRPVGRLNLLNMRITRADALRFAAFTFDGLYAVERALAQSYYRLRLFLLKNPHMVSARDAERVQLETALLAMGRGAEIARQTELAAVVFMKTREDERVLEEPVHPTGREG